MNAQVSQGQQLSSAIPPPFTQARLHYICEQIIAHGYRVVTFDSFVPAMLSEGALLLLRHDVDFSLERALLVARLEADYGLHATYFIRLHSPTYSPLSLASTAMIREIRRLGHQIGYHFESEYLTAQSPELSGTLGTVGAARDVDGTDGAGWAATMFRHDVRTLELITGHPVRAVAAHDPVRRGIAPSLPLHEFVNAYDPLFTRDMKYLSDSSRSWREGCFSEHVPRVGRYQVLIHPVWWCSEAGSASATLGELAGEEAAEIHRYYAEVAGITEQHVRERASLDHQFRLAVGGMGR